METVTTYLFIILMLQIVKLRRALFFWKFKRTVRAKKLHATAFGKIERAEEKRTTKNVLGTITVD